MGEIVAIEPNKIESIWPQVKDQIQSALNYTKGEISLNQVKEQLIKGNNLLLLVIDKKVIASVVCELVDTASLKVCHILACGGEQIDSWLADILKTIKTIAKEQGCKRVSLTGRKGWERKLNKDGFKHAYTTLDLDI